jgi:hypothetical protein
MVIYKRADNSLARLGRKQATATEDFDFHIQWTLESRKQSVPRGGSTFSLFDFQVKRHEPHDAVQCCAHGSTFEFLFEFQTEFFSNFLFEFQVVRESNLSTFEGPLYLIYNHNWRNINTIYLHDKTNIKWNILTIKQITSGSRSG